MQQRNKIERWWPSGYFQDRWARLRSVQCKAGRQRSKTTKTGADVYADLEDCFGVKDYTLKRQNKKITACLEYMSGALPLAIVQVADGYEIKTIEVDRQGAIQLLGRKARPRT